jgi:asparagine synthase (glutamine-hydrolysing)
MLGAIAHRGPDRRAAWSHGPIGFGHLLMRVTLEDSFDAQPLHDSASGLTLAADLRLDNREQLAAELNLAPAMLAKMPDSAVLMAAYQHWDEDCVQHLVGDFLFAIWDARAKKLVLARDHMGQRHILFHRGKNFLAFATEVNGLWALADVPRALSDTGLAQRLLIDMHPRKGETPFTGISALPGGTLMTIGADGSIAMRRYWEPHADPKHEGRDEAYYVQAYRRVLAEAVVCRVRRVAKPCGMLFGGGFDSTAIAGLAGPAVTAQGRKLICAASVMPAGYSGPIRHARQWVEFCRKKLPHMDVRYVTLEGRDVFEYVERDFVRDGTPHGVNRYVNDALMAVLAGAGARLVMDGHGGDYTLNPRAADMIAEFLRRGQFRRFFAEWRAYGRQHGQSAVGAVKKVMRDLFPRAMRLWRRIRRGTEPDYVEELLAPEFVRAAKAAGLVSVYRPLPHTRRVPRERMKYLLDLVSSDIGVGPANLAAHYGMEFTRPFHDKRVVELALAIPDALYFKNGRERHLAKLALADIYPPEFQTRGTANDDRTPDFLAMVRRIEPRLLAEIDRMEKSPALARIFNFTKVRKFLAQRPVEAQSVGRERDTIHATQMILWARYIEWFRRDNR